MDKFLYSIKPPKLSQEETNILNRHIINENFEIIIKEASQL